MVFEMYKDKYIYSQAFDVPMVWSRNSNEQYRQVIKKSEVEGPDVQHLIVLCLSHLWFSVTSTYCLPTLPTLQ